MATNTLFISVVGSATTTGLVPIGSDTNERMVTLTTTGPIYVAFDLASSSDANTALGVRPLVLAAGNIITLPNVVMSKAYVRSQTTSTTAASVMWYTP